MNLIKSTSFIFSAIVIMASCTSKPKTDEAKVSEAEEVTEVSGTELAVNKQEATMEWVGTKPTGRHYGEIALAEGDLKLSDDKLAGGKLVFNINEISVTDLKDDPESHDKLVGHLQSDDFFDAANHPKATFEIVSVKALNTAENVADEYDAYSKQMEQPAEGEKIMEVDEYKLAGATHEITGNLTMRGKKLAITVPAVINISEDSVQAYTNFSIDRTKWGLMYGDESKAVDKAKDKFIYNTVGVGFKLNADRKAAQM